MVPPSGDDEESCCEQRLARFRVSRSLKTQPLFCVGACLDARAFNAGEGARPSRLTIARFTRLKTRATHHNNSSTCADYGLPQFLVKTVSLPR